MQTQIKPETLSPLQRRAADLRDEINETRDEIDACPDERDADGCPFDNTYSDLCDHLDSLQTDLAEIEEQLEAENG
jgi:predicted  nucleic acid-binding Zn-ribbon protein